MWKKFKVWFLRQGNILKVALVSLGIAVLGGIILTAFHSAWLRFVLSGIVGLISLLWFWIDRCD